MDNCLLLDAGSGGRASQRLVAQCFLRHFANPLLERLDDAALLDGLRGFFDGVHGLRRIAAGGEAQSQH